VALAISATVARPSRRTRSRMTRSAVSNVANIDIADRSFIFIIPFFNDSFVVIFCFVSRSCRAIDIHVFTRRACVNPAQSARCRESKRLGVVNRRRARPYESIEFQAAIP
jgi:hypothetical protein